MIIVAPSSTPSESFATPLQSTLEAKVPKSWVLLPDTWDFSFCRRLMHGRYDSHTMLASIVVPAFNEGSGLAANLETLLRFLSACGDDFEYEVVMVDDGSNDDTFTTASAIASENSMLRVVRHQSNQGLGAAIRTGFAQARGSVIVTYDSDLSYRPDVISALLREQRLRDADLVLASPYMRGGSVANVPWLRRQLSREANRFLSFATNGHIATVTCMVRAYRASFFAGIETLENRMEINPELLFKAIKRGAVVVEIPARLEWSRDRARSHARINFKRTLKQIWRTLAYGVRHRPAVLFAIPAIAPGVLPLVVTLCVLFHLNIKTTGAITLVTMIIQNTSLAYFAGQLAVFGRNTLRRQNGASLPESFSKGPS